MLSPCRSWLALELCVYIDMHYGVSLYHEFVKIEK